jgi:hypothetical protein
VKGSRLLREGVHPFAQRPEGGAIDRRETYVRTDERSLMSAPLLHRKHLIQHPRQPHPRLIQPPPRNRKIRLRAGIRKLLAGLQHRSECIGPGVARPSTRRPASFVTWHAINS